MAKKKCPDCNGNARCKQCKGTGKFPYGSPSAKECTWCDKKGNGVCRRCHGNGEV
jgi:hypothetical protein